MTRLHHSYAGKLRSMQISAKQLFVFVEGKQCDPYFFAQICSTALGDRVDYEILTAQQIPGDAGGKDALLKFFTFLRQRKSLLSSLGGQTTACVFFLDKDIDDIRRKKRRSNYVVYTQYYDVQNYVFLHGDLVKGTAAAASVDPLRLQSTLCDASRWCEKVARLWMDWVALCIRMTEDAISSEANYRVLSKIQKRPCGPTDKARNREE